MKIESIFSKLFGNKEIDKTLTDIDSISQKYFKNSVESQDYNTLSKNAINDAIKTYSEDKKPKGKGKGGGNAPEQFEKILSDIEVPAERINRYEVYDHLYKSVQLIKRIITVYTNNIFQKDTINNEIFIITERESLTMAAEAKVIKFYVRQVIKYFQLDKKIKFHTGFNVLKYGDAFVEIINYSEVTNLDFPKVHPDELKKTEGKLLQEINIQAKSKNSKNEYIKKISGNDDIFVKQVLPIVCEFDDSFPRSSSDNPDLILEANDVELSANFFDINKLKQLALRFHKPHRIVPLITPFESVLGYIELTTISRNSNNTNTNFFKEIVQKFNDCGSGNSATTEKNNSDVLTKFTKEIVKTVLIRHKISFKEDQEMDEYINDIHEKVGDELFNSLKHILVTPESLFKDKLKIRFIKTEDMFWFKTPSSDYYPFGRSIIDPLVFPGKLYLFNQLANSVNKLSKSASLRKWTVETGSKEDSSGLLNQLKRNFKNQRITASDILASKDIANTLSDFKDMVVKMCYIEYRDVINYGDN